MEGHRNREAVAVFFMQTGAGREYAAKAECGQQ